MNIPVIVVSYWDEKNVLHVKSFPLDGASYLEAVRLVYPDSTEIYVYGGAAVRF